MIKRFLALLFCAYLSLLSSISMAGAGTGLEINQPETLQVVFTIEPAEVNQTALRRLVDDMLSEAGISPGSRPDAQLFLRVEEHAGRYLLYLDFSRQMHYRANGQCFTQDAFVWGRYAKNITDTAQLEEDVRFFFEDFLESYRKANQLD